MSGGKRQEGNAMTYKNVIFKYAMYRSNGTTKIVDRWKSNDLTDEDINEIVEAEQMDADTSYDHINGTLTVTFDCGDWD